MKNKEKIITTSWDDGNPLDLKIADLLKKYGLKGTFYIPKINSNYPVMNDKEILSLSTDFEIGGHTLNHINLNGIPYEKMKMEISACRNWIYEITGIIPKSFCYPQGRFDKNAIEIVKKAGFNYGRTVGLFKIKINNYFTASTTLQLMEHSNYVYFKNLIKRKNFTGLINLFQMYNNSDLISLTNYFLNQIELKGGIFHIWGHSWEIEEFNLWNKAEIVFDQLSQRKNFKFLNNGELVI